MNDQSAQIADLKAAHPGCRVVAFRGDPTLLVVRRPTEAEVLVIGDKLHLAGIVRPEDNAYNYDNGTAQILRLCEHPDLSAVERLAEQRPRIAATIYREVQRLCRSSLEPVASSNELHLSFLLDGKTTITIQRLNRAAYERLDFQRLKSDHRTLLPSWLAAAAKRALVAPVDGEADKLWEDHPFLSGILGLVLYGELSLEVVEEEGK